MIRHMKAYDIAIKKKLAMGVSEEDMVKDPDFDDYITPKYELYEDDDDFPPPGIMCSIDYYDDEKDYEADVDTYDQCVGARVQLTVGGKMLSGKVTGWKRKLYDSGRRKASSSPILEAWTYGIEFPDGSHAEYTANAIA
jgi:hypothetical protein